jgi:hypothetical protein
VELAGWLAVWPQPSQARAEEVKTSARSSPSVAVGALAVEKRLFRNVPRACLVGALFEKKFCDINERLNPF